MFKNLIRLIMTVVGGAVGYGICKIIYYLAMYNGLDVNGTIPLPWQYGITVLIAIIFACIFFSLTPSLLSKIGIMSTHLDEELKTVSNAKVFGSIVGLILGLIVAFFVSQMFSIITNRYVHAIVVVLIYAVLAIAGLVIGGSKLAGFFATLSSGKKESDKYMRQPSAVDKKRQKHATPKVLDTSVIIDGRILDILESGFLEGPIIIPEFVLVELRHIADSADDLKRERGRYGLDILDSIQKNYGIQIYNTDAKKELKKIPEVDVKLLKLADILGGKVVTNDYNLNKVAGIEGVQVLNINELSNCLKPVVLPGEEMSLQLIKKGKEREQAVGYLNDGTMIVVEDGRKKIGEMTKITVTSVLQTAAGRMIFGRIKVD